MKILELDDILNILRDLDPIPLIERGFAAYSQGRAVIPPVGELIFEEPPGELHIKYGYIRDGSYAVVKIASGFYRNVESGLPSGDGLMLAFDQRTGLLEAVLLDQGHLTNIRTAAAGAVAAKYLAPSEISVIGVFGAGIQGRLQVKLLQGIVPSREIMVWGINNRELDGYRDAMQAEGYTVHTTREAADIASACRLIITATPSRTPLFSAGLIRPGTHITALGSDTPEKQELDPEILSKADIVVADSLAQSRVRGEIFQALRAGRIREEKIRELGDIITKPDLRRSSDEQITVADLTGVAVQDIQIASAVIERALNPPSGAVSG